MISKIKESPESWLAWIWVIGFGVLTCSALVTPFVSNELPEPPTAHVPSYVSIDDPLHDALHAGGVEHQVRIVEVESDALRIWWSVATAILFAMGAVVAFFLAQVIGSDGSPFNPKNTQRVVHASIAVYVALAAYVMRGIFLEGRIVDAVGLEAHSDSPLLLVAVGVIWVVTTVWVIWSKGAALHNFKEEVI